MTNCKFMKFSLILILGFVISGCAASSMLVVHKPISVQLSNYKNLVVNVDTVVANSDKERTFVETLLISKLKESGAFEKIYSEKIDSLNNADIKLDVIIKELKKVSNSARIMVGALAGRGKITADIKLSDVKENNIISEATVEGITSGGSVMAGTTEQAIDKLVEEIIKFFQN